MNLKKFKLGVGPMSPEVVEICLEYSKVYDFPIMIIASRNQVDTNSGYSFTTKNLVDFIKSNINYDPQRIMICRDHCGPYYGDIDNELSVEDALKNCINTIESDIMNGFNLIHVDISRVSKEEKYTMAHQLINHILKLKPDMMLEFGSEDNLSVEENNNQIHYDVEFSRLYPNNIKFVVGRTGSLTKHNQVGHFDVTDNIKLAEVIHKNGFLFKEHNADYLTKQDIDLRKQAGVDSLNIAPQLGVIHTNVLTTLGKEFENEFNIFKKYVLEQEVWKKWITSEVTDDKTKLLVSGHYFLNSIKARQLIGKLDIAHFKTVLKTEIFAVLDIYRKGLGNEYI
jgi:tagatose-1,6-bisphosphate aldolase non-catalytic subunit AgaZ/GatZ